MIEKFYDPVVYEIIVTIAKISQKIGILFK